MSFWGWGLSDLAKPIIGRMGDIRPTPQATRGVNSVLCAAPWAQHMSECRNVGRLQRRMCRGLEGAQNPLYRGRR